MYRVPSARLRRSTLFLGITGIAALVLVACGSDTPTATPAPPTSTTPPATTAPVAGAITIQLTAQNNSGQSGTATLTAKSDQTEVVLALNVGPAGAGVAQPVHIHTGTCATLGGVVYPLTNLADGKSTTTVNVKLDALRTGAFAINAHKSGQEASVYTSCGNIPAASTSSSSGGDYDYNY